MCDENPNVSLPDDKQNLIQILVAAVTVGFIRLVLRLRSSSDSCERDVAS
jgi:hypothetical protein